jgi:hypothetical protein
VIRVFEIVQPFDGNIHMRGCLTDGTSA